VYITFPVYSSLLFIFITHTINTIHHPAITGVWNMYGTHFNRFTIENGVCECITWGAHDTQYYNSVSTIVFLFIDASFYNWGITDSFRGFVANHTDPQNRKYNHFQTQTDFYNTSTNEGKNKSFDGTVSSNLTHHSTPSLNLNLTAQPLPRYTDLPPEARFKPKIESKVTLIRKFVHFTYLFCFLYDWSLFFHSPLLFFFFLSLVLLSYSTH